jgi:GT2 family glycosyltransferase
MRPKPPDFVRSPSGAETETAPASETVSVVVCGYSDERWDDMLSAIDSVADQRVAARETIVVIDHNDALLRRLRAARPHVIALPSEGARGLSGARNTGVAAARGSIVAFLDDDARADRGWLERLLAPYDDPSVAGVGGRVDADWPHGRPRWFPREFDWVVGCSYAGLPDRREPIRNMIGANMSLRRSVFDAVGGFRDGIGRIGKRPLGCEETELCIRVRQQLPDATILFEPSASVVHRVTGERASWRYFGSRCYAEGLSKAAIASTVGRSDSLSSERAHVMRTLPRGVIRGLADALRRGDAGGLGRAVAIVSGLALTIAGYARGRLFVGEQAAATGTGSLLRLAPTAASDL